MAGASWGSVLALGGWGRQRSAWRVTCHISYNWMEMIVLSAVKARQIKKLKLFLFSWVIDPSPTPGGLGPR